MQSPEKIPPQIVSGELAWLGEARRRGLLARLSDRQVAAFVKGAQRVEYPSGTVGMRWDEGPKTAIVLRGSLRAYMAFPDGGQATARYLKPGDMTGVYAPRKPVIARGVQAIDRSELLIIDGGRMKELSLADPEFAWALIEELTTVLNANQRSHYIRAFGTVRQRVVCAIVDRATTSGQIATGVQITGTQQDLAIAVGSVREVVASILGNLKHEGLIDIRRGGIVILDPLRLAQEADSVIGATA
jgi:CRP/FNR family transcriptional regulator, cyclic AMP receptor protein